MLPNSAFNSKRKALLSIVMVLLLLGVAELGLLLWGVGPAHPPDIIGWRMPLNAVKHAITDQQNQNTFFVSTNSEGLRTNVKPEKPTNLVRIVLTGDSTVFGWGVSDQETLAVYLQEELRSKNPRGMDEIEVINTAQPGYSSAQVFKIFEETIRHYKPDWILAFPPFHDDRPALVSDWEALNQVRWTRVLGVLLARYSRIYHILYTTIKGPIRTDVTGEYEHTGTQRVSDAERTEIYTRIQSMAEEWGGRVILAAMIFGEDIQLNPRFGDDYPMWQWMKRTGEQYPEIPVIDLRYCCVNPETSYTIPGDPGHLNPLGNQRVASCIAEQWHPNKSQPNRQ